MKVDLTYAERQLRHWCKKVDELRLTSNASNAKEDEKGKETFPPAPPIEKSPKAEENNNHDNRGRARELTNCSQRPTLKDVAAFVAEIGSDIDPAYFWRYYNSNHRRWPSEWRDRLCNWTGNGNPRGRIKPEDECTVHGTAPKKKTDWTLCAERCAHCDGTRCRRGIATPPAEANQPRPPEECPQFQPSETTNN